MAGASVPSWRLAPLGLAVLLLSIMAARRAAAVEAPIGTFIPPGKEAVVRGVVERSLESAGRSGTAYSAFIDRDVVRLRVPLDAADEVELVVEKPGIEPLPEHGRAIASNVAIRCKKPCTDAQLAEHQPLAEALARERDLVAEDLWGVRYDAPKSVGWPRAVTWGVAGYAVLWLGFALLGGVKAWWRREPGWQQMVLCALLLAFVALVFSEPNRMPLHDHNSFVGRSDCAYDPDCDHDPRGPAWGSPTFHVYGALLHLLPYRVANLSLLSIALSLATVVLLYAFVRLLFERFERRAEGRRVALWAVAFLVFNPLFLRLAVAGTFWPYAMVCVLGAAVALLYTLEAEGFDGVLAAACLLALALTSSYALLPLAVMFFAAPLAWRRGRPAGSLKWSLPLGLAVVAGFVAPHVEQVARTAFGGDESVLGPASGLAAKALAMVGSFHLTAYDLRLASWPVAVLVTVGLWCVVRSSRQLAPVAVALVVVHAFLSLWADPIAPTYPVGFINHFYSLYFLAFFAACGADWLWQRLPRGRRISGTAVMAVLPLAFLPCAGEALAFLRGERVLERELSALSGAFEELPEHDVLVVPPVILKYHEGLPRDGDPVEAFFPKGEYRYVSRLLGRDPAPTIDLERFLEEPSGIEGKRVLLYVGSTLRTFQPAEIAAGVVPESLERPLLLRARERYLLEPARTFRLRTAQHPSIIMRLGADRVADIEVGFFWVHRRPR